MRNPRFLKKLELCRANDRPTDAISIKISEKDLGPIFQLMLKYYFSAGQAARDVAGYSHDETSNHFHLFCGR